MNTKHKTSFYLRQDAVGAVVTALLDQVVVSIELWPLGRFDEQHERRVVLSIPVAISRHEAVVLTDVIRELKALPSAGPRWPNDDGNAQWGLGDARASMAERQGHRLLQGHHHPDETEMNKTSELGGIDPSTFTIDVSLEIACSDDDQILSRPVGDGYTWEQLVQSHVRFSGYDADVGAVPIGADDAGGELTVTGYCESAEFNLSATTFEGKTIHLGRYGSEGKIRVAIEALAVQPNPARILQPSTSSCPDPVAVGGRDFLINLYLDWRNNWLSVEAFAQHHGLTDQQAIALLATARTVVGQPHPES